MQEFLKQYKGIVERADTKLKELGKDTVITNSIIFTNQTEFYYLFKVYQNKICIKKVKATNSKEFDKAFKELADKYGANIIFDYTDLSRHQIIYLQNLDKDNRANQDELYSEFWNRPLI